jgi:peptidoglycan/LPS O-acetylase OafA/YrhL
MKKKLSNIQNLRAYAALLVVLSHTIGRAIRDDIDVGSFISENPNYVVLGHIGVDLFFIISGFIMIVSTNKSAAEYSCQDVFNFYIKRGIRIAPIYWALTLFAAFLLYVYPEGFSFRSKPELKWVIDSLLFIPAVTSDGLPSPVLGVGWTLNFEVYFYLIFGVSLLTRSPFFFSSMIILVGATFGIILENEGAINGYYKSYLDIILSPLLLEFMIGMVIAKLYLNNKLGLLKNRLSNYLLGLIALLIMVTIHPTTDYQRVIYWGTAATAIFFIFITSTEGDARLKSSEGINNMWERVSLTLGEASYSIYLVQVFSIPAFSVIFSQYISSGLIYIILSIIFTVLSALIFWMYFERPLTTRLRKLVIKK